jgi:stage II sporulation protein D
MLPEKEPLISVGILSNKQINFELYGDFLVEGYKKTFNGRFSAELKNNIIVCKSDKDKLEVAGEIIFSPGDISTDSFLVKKVLIGKDFHWERKENQRFTGSLKLISDNDNILVINVIPLEEYLKSVISSEMSAKSSLHLLIAHSVISRSWLLAQVEKQSSQTNTQVKSFHRSDSEIIRWQGREDHTLFDVCADDHCQRYQGITKVSTMLAKQAVEKSYGIVLLHNNKICDARYSKSCGGISEAFENVWEPVKYDYLTPVIDYKYEPENYNTDFSSEDNARKWILGNPPAFCNTTDRRILSQILLDYDQETHDFYRWKVEYTQEQISAIIKEKTGIDFGDIIDLVPVERGDSARLIKLKITGSKKSLIIGKELEIRRALSKTHLYSSAIVIDKEEIRNNVPQKFIIHGCGWGHGVGLCQIGAAVMASQGYQFDEILLHYFKGARLKKIY